MPSAASKNHALAAALHGILTYLDDYPDVGPDPYATTPCATTVPDGGYCPGRDRELSALADSLSEAGHAVVRLAATYTDELPTILINALPDIRDIIVALGDTIATGLDHDPRPERQMTDQRRHGNVARQEWVGEESDRDTCACEVAAFAKTLGHPLGAWQERVLEVFDRAGRLHMRQHGRAARPEP